MSARRVSTIASALALAAVAAAIGCSKSDSLVLLDLRSSGPLGAPVARIRLSAKGWPTRVVSGSIGPDGFQVGYYGPGNGGAVSVTAEALDAGDCVLGSGSATVAKLAAGATSAPTRLFVRPLPANGCVPDAGAMDSGDDSGGNDGGTDGGNDAMDSGGNDGGADGGNDAMDSGGNDGAGTDGGNDAAAGDGGGADGGVDAAPEAGADADVGVDSAADAMSEAGDEAGADAADEAGTDAADEAGTDAAADAGDDASD